MPRVLSASGRSDQGHIGASPGLDTAYPALILKASRDIIHHGALGIARTLGRLGVPVYAIVEDAYTPLATSRYLTKAFVWERWPDDRVAFLNAISAVADSINRPAILVPFDDLSAVFIAENASALRRWFLFPMPPLAIPRRLANKSDFYSLCADIGIVCPRSVTPRSVGDIDEFIKHIEFPVVVKAAEQWKLLNDKYNAVVIQTREDLFKFYDKMVHDQRSRIILQEYIPGEHWIYHGYSNSEKNLFVGFTGKKLLSYPPSAGATALGVSARNDALQIQSEKLLRAISYSGLVDMDWRKDERDGQYKILDCNPRVGMNFRMFENGAGIDVVRAQHLDLTGRGFDCPRMIENRLFVVEPYYLLASLRGARRDALRIGRYADVPPGNRELAWWSSDDKLPFFVMSVRLLLRTIERAFLSVWNRMTVMADK